MTCSSPPTKTRVFIISWVPLNLLYTSKPVKEYITSSLSGKYTMETSHYILLFYLILEVISHQHILNNINSLFIAIHHSITKSCELASPSLRVFLVPASRSCNAIRIFWSKLLRTHASVSVRYTFITDTAGICCHVYRCSIIQELYLGYLTLHLFNLE